MSPTSESVEVTLPSAYLAHFQSKANMTQRTLQDEILDSLATVVADEREMHALADAAVRPLSELEDTDLWEAAESHLTEAERNRLEELHWLRQSQALTPSEDAERRDLLQQYEVRMLVRATAMATLKHRGHDISKLLAS